MRKSPLAAAGHVRRALAYLWREWIRPLGVPLFLILAAKSAIAEINIVPSGSMQPTILPGDAVFVDKRAYDLRLPFTFARVARWADPARGDIVVTFSPEDGQRIVKRVIGQPGDVVELRANVLLVNGVPATYSLLAPAASRDLPADERASSFLALEKSAGRAHAVMSIPSRPAPRDFPPIRVPAGRYFLMGDNRDNSYDSRYYGTVPRREIIGRAHAVVVSGDPDHWLRPRFHRFFTRLE